MFMSNHLPGGPPAIYRSPSFRFSWNLNKHPSAATPTRCGAGWRGSAAGVFLRASEIETRMVAMMAVRTKEATAAEIVAVRAVAMEVVIAEARTVAKVVVMEAVMEVAKCIGDGGERQAAMELGMVEAKVWRAARAVVMKAAREEAMTVARVVAKEAAKEVVMEAAMEAAMASSERSRLPVSMHRLTGARAAGARGRAQGREAACVRQVHEPAQLARRPSSAGDRLRRRPTFFCCVFPRKCNGQKIRSERAPLGGIRYILARFIRFVNVVAAPRFPRDLSIREAGGY